MTKWIDESINQSVNKWVNEMNENINIYKWMNELMNEWLTGHLPWHIRISHSIYKAGVPVNLKQKIVNVNWEKSITFLVYLEIVLSSLQN